MTMMMMMMMMMIKILIILKHFLIAPFLAQTLSSKRWAIPKAFFFFFFL